MSDNLVQLNYSTVLPMETVCVSEETKIYVRNSIVKQNIEGLTAKGEKRWLNWRFEFVKGRWTKVPYMPNGRHAASNNPSTWSTLEDVLAAENRFNGIGVVFDGLLTDIDHCLVDGKISHDEKEKIEKFLDKANSYAEISPSGTGLHSLVPLTAPLELKEHRNGPYEVYATKRYFTVTGIPFGEAKPVRNAIAPEEAESLLSIIGYPWKTERREQGIEPMAKISLDDETVLSKMFASKHGAKIKALYDGDLAEYNNDHSSADMALCSYLAYWTGKNEEQMDRIWCNSPLGSREKTQQRNDYRDRTIKKAINECKDVYKGEIDEFEWAFANKKVQTLKIAQHLIEKYHVKTIGERVLDPYIYKDGTYVFGLNILKAEIQEILKNLATPQQKKNIIEMIKDSTLTDRDDFDVDKNFINLENGIFDIKNNVLLPHSHEFPFFTKIPVVYDANAQCSEINKFLHEILPDEYVKIVIEWFGYCLYRSYFIKKAIIFAGEKDTGKTTTLKLYGSFVGKHNTSGISLQKIAADKFASSNLYNKHINIYDELAFKDINDNGQFKMVTGDGIISGEKKFGEQFQFKNYSKLTFACNKIPDVKDGNDSAYFSRWIIVPFLAEIKAVDKFLSDKITTEKELSGLLNLAIAGLNEIIKNQDFSYGKDWKEIKKEMLLSGSMVANFVQDRLAEETDSWVSKDDMYEECAKYARANNLPVISKENLGKKLPNHSGYILDGDRKIDGKVVHGWRNVRFKEAK